MDHLNLILLAVLFVAAFVFQPRLMLMLLASIVRFLPRAIMAVIGFALDLVGLALAWI